MEKNNKYYVKNEDILPEIKQLRETGIMSEKLGSIIISIATNYSSKGNFASYTWKEDMIGEAILTCVKYLKNFNPEKSNNPFAYITTICKNAFINFIKKQNKHSAIKDKFFNNKQILMEVEETFCKCEAINYTSFNYIEEDLDIKDN